jgi:ectoine hydroxylase-related dioxygenase (phytanoyl-CoA dioxygenase family)
MKENTRLLSKSKINAFRDEGYLILEGILSEDEIAVFLKHEENRTADRPKGLRRHTTDGIWRNLACHPRIAGVAEQLLDGPPRIVQTMYLAKPPATEAEAKGKGIALHQDSHYLPNEPNTLMACWVAMNDTDADNGGLCVVPGSHLGGLRSTHPNADDDHISWDKEQPMRDRNGREWMQRFYSFQIDGLQDSDIKRLTVPKGSVVFFTGMTIHGSFANQSRTRERLAFAVHYVKEGTWVFRTDVLDTVTVRELPAAAKD